MLVVAIVQGPRVVIEGGVGVEVEVVVDGVVERALHL